MAIYNDEVQWLQAMTAIVETVGDVCMIHPQACSWHGDFVYLNKKEKNRMYENQVMSKVPLDFYSCTVIVWPGRKYVYFEVAHKGRLCFTEQHQTVLKSG